jgi:hypothetical protein
MYQCKGASANRTAFEGVSYIHCPYSLLTAVILVGQTWGEVLYRSDLLLTIEVTGDKLQLQPSEFLSDLQASPARECQASIRPRRDDN